MAAVLLAAGVALAPAAVVATHQFRCPQTPVVFSPVIASTFDWPRGCRLCRQAVASCNVLTDPYLCTLAETGYFYRTCRCPDFVNDPPTFAGVDEAFRQLNSIIVGAFCPAVPHGSDGSGADIVIVREKSKGGVSGAAVLLLMLLVSWRFVARVFRR